VNRNFFGLCGVKHLILNDLKVKNLFFGGEFPSFWAEIVHVSVSVSGTKPVKQKDF